MQSETVWSWFGADSAPRWQEELRRWEVEHPAAAVAARAAAPAGDGVALYALAREAIVDRGELEPGTMWIRVDLDTLTAGPRRYGRATLRDYDCLLRYHAHRCAIVPWGQHEDRDLCEAWFRIEPITGIGKGIGPEELAPAESYCADLPRRRGPGRPPDLETQARRDRRIAEALNAADGLVPVGAIVEATGLSYCQARAALLRLLAAGSAVRVGNTRGARYRSVVPKDPAPPRDAV